MANKKRGFAAMDADEQKQIASLGGKTAHKKGTAHEFTSKEAQEAGRKGGQASPTKFKAGDKRTIDAARKGGEARAQDEDVKSGELGKKGAAARWDRD